MEPDEYTEEHTQEIIEEFECQLEFCENNIIYWTEYRESHAEAKTVGFVNTTLKALRLERDGLLATIRNLKSLKP